MLYAQPVFNYLQASLIIQNVYVPFVPTYVKPVLMNVQSLTVKFASNAQKNVEPVPKAVKKWQLKKNVKRSG
ncbi:hypothetical protein [Gillisia sp. Hel_I_29]|uniref:hypothetical protein n=1 Tax=Gillisia sp. Hel_I_29 TaxID=1249975 RepID=UPI0012E03DA5|nr:hypothetical protein [Gillisia sp. Hel_I_29]